MAVGGRDEWRDDRPVARDPHLLDMRLAATTNPDLLTHNLGPLPLTFELIARWIGWVEPLDVQVLHIVHTVGHAPCDPLIMTDDDTGRAGQAGAGHMVVTAVEVHLVPQ